MFIYPCGAVKPDGPGIVEQSESEGSGKVP